MDGLNLGVTLAAAGAALAGVAALSGVVLARREPKKAQAAVAVPVEGGWGELMERARHLMVLTDALQHAETVQGSGSEGRLRFVLVQVKPGHQEVPLDTADIDFLTTLARRLQRVPFGATEEENPLSR